MMRMKRKISKSHLLQFSSSFFGEIRVLRQVKKVGLYVFMCFQDTEELSKKRKLKQKIERRDTTYSDDDTIIINEETNEDDHRRTETTIHSLGTHKTTRREPTTESHPISLASWSHTLHAHEMHVNLEEKTIEETEDAEDA